MRAVDQRAVELEDVGRDPDDLLQPGVAGAGVVQRHLSATLAERPSSSSSDPSAPNTSCSVSSITIPVRSSGSAARTGADSSARGDKGLRRTVPRASAQSGRSGAPPRRSGLPPSRSRSRRRRPRRARGSGWRSRPEPLAARGRRGSLRPAPTAPLAQRRPARAGRARSPRPRAPPRGRRRGGRRNAASARAPLDDLVEFAPRATGSSCAACTERSGPAAAHLEQLAQSLLVVSGNHGAHPASRRWSVRFSSLEQPDRSLPRHREMRLAIVPAGSSSDSPIVR